MLKSERVYLRLFDENDIPLRVKWMNDPEVREKLNSPYPVSELSTRLWLQGITNNQSRIDLAICLNETDQTIGYTGFRDIDFINAKAESYTGIGEVEHWGKGYAKESKILALKYIFNRYNINKVYAMIREDHQQSLKLNKSIGYKVDGILREEVFSGGVFHNRIVTSILRDEFLKKYSVV